MRGNYHAAVWVSFYEVNHPVEGGLVCVKLQVDYQKGAVAAAKLDGGVFSIV